MRFAVRLLPLVVLCFLLAPFTFAQSGADLSVVKTGTAQAPAGGEVSYDVVVTNNGPGDALSVTLTDQIPFGMNYVSGGQNTGPAFTCPLPPGDDTIDCTLALFPAGASASFTFVFEIAGSMYGGSDPFINVATASSQTPDPNSANNTDDAVTTMPAADLVLTKTGPDSATIGSDVTYTVTVTNDGPDESLSVQVRDAVPDGMTFVSYTNSPAFSCVDPDVGNNFTIICDAESLAPGETAVFTFVFNIPAETAPGTIFSNSANVRSVSEEDLSLQVFDPNEENNVDTVVTATAGPPQGDVAVLKEGPAAAPPDSDVTYTITLSSLGPAAAENVSLEDTLPATMTFVSLEQDPAAALNCTTPAVGAGGTVTCTAASLAPGVTVTLTLTAHIPAEAQSGNVFANSVAVTATNDSSDENNTSGVNTSVVVADISVLKQGPAGPLAAGSNIQYDITITNAGPDDATVTLTDQLPPGTTFVSITPSTDCLTPPAGTNGTVSCTLLVESSQVLALTLVVKSGDTTSVTNTATVASEFTFDPDDTDNSSSVTTLITPQADLAITKSGPAPVTAGTDVTYTLTVTNNGPSTATNVSLTDTVPANTTFVSAVQNTGPDFNCGQAGGVLTCTAAALSPGATATFTFTVHVDPAASGQLDNTASVSSSVADPNDSNNSSTVSAAIVTSADLAVAKTGPAAATAGTNVTYTVIATNNGPSTASTVTLTDILPTGSTTFVSATQDSGPTFNCAEAAGTITCTIAAFAPGAPATFTFVAAVSPEAANVISNVATINSATPDPDGSNNAASVPTTLGATADLSVTKTGPAAATAGSDVTYTLTVTNGGPSIASNVSLTDTLPVNATFVSLNQTAGPAFTCNPPAAGQVVCTIASLAVADIATFTLTTNVNAGASGTVDNTATVTSNTADPDPSDNTATAIAGIDAGPTDLTITKTASGTQFGPGAPVTYTITVTNAGPGVAFATTVTDVLPAGTTFVSATPSQGSCTGTTTVVCALGTLAPASSATIALVVTLPATQGQVVNTATVSAVNVDTNGANNASTNALAVVAHIPSLSQYGLMLLAMMMAVAGLLAVRR